MCRYPLYFREKESKQTTFLLNLSGFQYKIRTFATEYQLRMARPIKNTPALYGKDATRFIAEISNLPSTEERKRERIRVKKSVREFMSLVAQHQKL